MVHDLHQATRIQSHTYDFSSRTAREVIHTRRPRSPHTSQSGLSDRAICYRAVVQLLPTARDNPARTLSDGQSRRLKLWTFTDRAPDPPPPPPKGENERSGLTVYGYPLSVTAISLAGACGINRHTVSVSRDSWIGRNTHCPSGSSP